MKLQLRDLAGEIHDRAAIAALLLLSPSSTTTTETKSPALAVLRATTHLPSDAPPSPRRLAALLAFGGGPRSSAAAVAAAVASRLSAARSSVVALKCLIVAHLLLRRDAPFILRDQIAAALRPTSGRRSPLLLSSFRDASSPFIFSSLARFVARHVERLLLLPFLLAAVEGEEEEEERAAGLTNRGLIREIELLIGVVEEIRAAAPELGAAAEGGNALAREAVRMVEEDGEVAEAGIAVRVREVRVRLGSMGFEDSVELVCLARRLEKVGGGAGMELAAAEDRRRRRVTGRDDGDGRSRSDRLGAGRVGELEEEVKFASARWNFL